MIFYKISKQTIQVRQKAEFSRAEKFKKTVSKPVLEALDTTLSTKVSNATGIRNFSVKVVALENSAFFQYSLLGNFIKYQSSRHRHLHVDLSIF